MEKVYLPAPREGVVETLTAMGAVDLGETSRPSVRDRIRYHLLEVPDSWTFHVQSANREVARTCNNKYELGENDTILLLVSRWVRGQEEITLAVASLRFPPKYREEETRLVKI